MDAASVVQLKRTNDTRARIREISADLRAAVANGDEAGITIHLEELLRFRGSSRAQTVALQHRALQGLVTLLRSAVMNDELTGLLNRRGFLQCATRLLDVAVRDRRPHRLFYFRLAPRADDAALPIMTLRQMGNALRDVFSDYGVREALGRLGAAEFAALTPRNEYVSRDSILEPIAALAVGRTSAARLAVGIAHFDPQSPVGINELVARSIQQALHARETLGRIASSVSGPPTRSDASLTVSGRRLALCED